MLEESVSPFIDEGDGITSERERVRTLLSLAAHAGGYKMMVGAHSTIYCQTHVGGCIVFFRYGTLVPATLLISRGIQGVLPCSPGTINVGAHNTIDASEARGGSLTVFV